ncbi:hypothetical protein [Listeria cossartiae]|uniref:hypothetical protein n=1 Tax=Listeria cossartiae TaxID=2838249 RepID=UPI0028800C46|nr:hypothetical protein [Listeria cossartiae]MDT0013850.1 hypothetical protein [Listeria cossartiae subsp. cayugensis]
MPIPAKSARLKILHGNTGKQNTNELKKRAKNEERMKKPTNKLRSPPWLDKEGREAFLFVVKELTEIDVASNADLHIIALYENFYSQYLKYRRLVKVKGIWGGLLLEPYQELLTNWYAERLLDGDILVSKENIAMAKRHLNDLKRQGTDEFPWIFDEERGHRPIRFVEENCKPIEGDFEKFILQL